jgi:hypothetical protein
LAALHRDRLAFVGKCWHNGNPFAECSCTYSALAKLPENYRDLAMSWAHDNRATYAVNIMYLIVAEARRAAGNKAKAMWDIGDAKTIQAWVSMVGAAVQWGGSHGDVTTAATRLAVEHGLPIVYGASAEFLNARGTLDEHCGRGDTWIVQVNKARVEAEKIAASLSQGTIEVVKDSGSKAAVMSAGALLWVWSWLKSWIWH